MHAWLLVAFAACCSAIFVVDTLDTYRSHELLPSLQGCVLAEHPHPREPCGFAFHPWPQGMCRYLSAVTCKPYGPDLWKALGASKGKLLLELVEVLGGKAVSVKVR